MTVDPLKTLLERADSQCEPTLPTPGEMVRRVERAARQQRRHREILVALSSSVVLAIVGVSAWRLSSSESIPAADQPQAAAAIGATKIVESPTSGPTTEPTPTPFEAEHALAELAALNAEADLHWRTAQRIIAERERDATLALARRALTDEEPAQVVRERLDLVAYRMIARADRLRDEPRPHEDPAQIYREIVRLFPTTDSAAEARIRLAELNTTEPPGGA
ncbi:MAG TPA: hypothetical protein VGJ26_19370 [Pirellulales bacterium]|jgi:hypothetical protein